MTGDEMADATTDDGTAGPGTGGSRRGTAVGLVALALVAFAGVSLVRGDRGAPGPAPSPSPSPSPSDWAPPDRPPPAAASPFPEGHSSLGLADVRALIRRGNDVLAVELATGRVSPVALPAGRVRSLVVSGRNAYAVVDDVGYDLGPGARGPLRSLGRAVRLAPASDGVLVVTTTADLREEVRPSGGGRTIRLRAGEQAVRRVDGGLLLRTGGSSYAVRRSDGTRRTLPTGVLVGDSSSVALIRVACREPRCPLRVVALPSGRTRLTVDAPAGLVAVSPDGAEAVVAGPGQVSGVSLTGEGVYPIDRTGPPMRAVGWVVRSSFAEPNETGDPELALLAAGTKLFELSFRSRKGMTSWSSGRVGTLPAYDEVLFL